MIPRSTTTIALIMLVAMLVACIQAAPGPMPMDIELSRDLLPPEVGAQNYWGAPSDAADPIPPMKPDSVRISDSDEEPPAARETHRVLMIFTEEGPVVSKDEKDKNGKDDSKDDSGDDNSAQDGDDDNDSNSTDSPVTSTPVPSRIKRNKNPIRYNRRTPKNYRFIF